MKVRRYKFCGPSAAVMVTTQIPVTGKFLENQNGAWDAQCCVPGAVGIAGPRANPSCSHVRVMPIQLPCRILVFDTQPAIHQRPLGRAGSWHASPRDNWSDRRTYPGRLVDTAEADRRGCCLGRVILSHGQGRCSPPPTTLGTLTVRPPAQPASRLMLSASPTSAGRSGTRSACVLASKTRIFALLNSRDEPVDEVADSPSGALRMIAICCADPAAPCTKGSCQRLYAERSSVPDEAVKLSRRNA